MTSCVVLQPSYIPWRGYFHQIQKADVFVFYDDVQYDKHGWRNRNRIKSVTGGHWLTVPVDAKGVTVQGRAINEIRIRWDQPWNDHHWETLRHTYAKAPYFRQFEPLVRELYGGRPEFLADLTIDGTIALARALGLTHTKFVRSSELGATGSKTDRLLQVLRAVDATHYISGPSARAYMEEEKLASAGISLEYMAYDYPEYPQLYPPFDGQVTIIDLLFMTGCDASRYIWGKE